MVNFMDDISRDIYENLLKYDKTNDAEFLISALKISGQSYDPAIKEYDEIIKLSKQRKKLILYGIGLVAKNFALFEKKCSNFPGFMHYGFFGGINWYGFGDKNPQKELFYGKEICPLETLAQNDNEDCIYYIATPKYYEEIRQQFINIMGDKVTNRVKMYPYPKTEMNDDKQYFDDFMLSQNEGIVIDGGCFDCGTIESFLKWNDGRGYKKIIAFEPDPINYSLCKGIIDKEGYTNVELVPAGLGEKNDSVNFAATADAGAHFIPSDSDSGTKINTYCLDSYLANETDQVSFIKMDIEGYELQALKGAEAIIKKSHPRMAICLYHKREDLWKIPDYINSLDCGYKFYLRMYSNSYFEIVLYAV